MDSLNNIYNIRLKIPILIKRLQENYKVKYNENCELITIRHYDQKTIDMVSTGKEILVEQKSRFTARMIARKPKI